MHWELTAEHESLQKMCRQFVDRHLRPIIEESERNGPPTDVWQEAGAVGLLGLLVPDEFGGSQGDVLAVTIVAEELSRSSGGLAITPLASAYMAGPHINAYGTEAQKQKYLPGLCAGTSLAAILVSEAGGGSDVARLKTTAKRDGDDWLLDGGKMYITNASIASVLIVAARTGEPGHRGISTFVVDADTPGITFGPPLQKMGWHASDTREVHLDSVRVPSHALLGEQDRGFYQIMQRFTLERVVLAGMCLGAAADCIDLVTDRARNRVVFGQRLADLQSVRHRIARMHIDLETSRAVTYQAAQRVQTQHQDANRSTAIAKYQAATMANRVADEAVQLFGGDGVLDSAVARHFRDVRALRIGGGTDEIQLELLSRHLSA